MFEDAELEAAFNADLIARTRALREARGWTQSKMATYLGIPLDRYKKYESRSPLPQYLIPRFADFVGRDIEYVLTGQEPRR